VTTLNGTSNDDILFLPAGSSGNELLGLGGNDSLDATTGAGNNILRGGDGNDELFAFTNDQLFGDAGNDNLYSDGNGRNTLSGGDGNDTIFADRNDIVFGDNGNDVIYGGSSGNKLTGGAGKDTFYITTSGVPDIPNEVLDFKQGDDKILIAAIPEVKAFADLIRVQTGADTTLRANIGGTVRDLGIIKNFKADSLTRVDFNFGPALINTAPAVSPDKTLTVAENAASIPLGIAAPTDVDGDPLTLVVNSVPDAAKGQILLGDGSVVQTGTSLTPDQLTALVFAPANNANGSAGTFSSTVSDGQGGTATQNVAVTITPKTGSSNGDPHITTFDGFYYDFQAIGDFALVRGVDSDLEIQVRQTSWVYNSDVTINTGLATVVDGYRVEFYADRLQPLVNNIPLTLQLGESIAIGNGQISRTTVEDYGTQGDRYTIRYANGDKLSANIFQGFLIDPSVEITHNRNVVGLLGNNNGNISDDLALNDGSILTNPLAPETLYGDFANSWRISDTQSLFSTAFSLPQASSPSNSSNSEMGLNEGVQAPALGENINDTLIGADITPIESEVGETDLLLGTQSVDAFAINVQDNPNPAGFDSISDRALGVSPFESVYGTGISPSLAPSDLIGIVQGETNTNINLFDSTILQPL
jgi:von Willebrand factor type D domain/RTX calcium-binding nonapeptide repeat (4 copies)